MSVLLSCLLAVAFSATFFGKAIVGIIMAVMVLVSIGYIGYHRASFLTKDNVINLLKQKEIWAIVVMLLLWLVSSVTSIYPDKSLHQLMEYAGMILGAVLLYITVNRAGFRFEIFAKITIAIATLCATYLLLTPYLGDYALIWRSSYGSVLAVLTPIAVYLALTDHRFKILWWGMAFIMISAIFASGGRTAWVALVAMIVVMPWCFPNLMVKARVAMFVGLLILTAIGSFVGLYSYKQSVGQEVYDIRTQAMTNMDRPASGRLTVWANTWTKIKDRPLLGYGIKTAKFLEISKGGDALVAHVHNVILEVWLETGLLGLLGFICALGVFVWRYIRAYIPSNDLLLKQQSMTIFMACMVYGVCSLSLTSMFHAWWFLYLVGLLILLRYYSVRLVK